MTLQTSRTTNHLTLRPIIMFAMMITLLLTPVAVSAQTGSNSNSDAKAVATIIRRAGRTLHRANSQAQYEEGFKLLLTLKQYKKSRERLNTASRRDIGDAIYNLNLATAQILGTTVPANVKTQLAKEMNEFTTVGQVVTEFYDSMIEGAQH